jgi:glycosyltransferase involved in cell wall biosynthesis
MLIEAFACAVPVIASDSGEIPHVVGGQGFIVPENDVLGWKQAIETLLRDEELRKRTGLAGMARVSQFSVPTVALQFRDFYRDLANGESR